jgi:hypothetical protein
MNDKEDDDDRDFKWFTSGKANTWKYRGKYIAIWNEHVVAVALDAVKAEGIAKMIYGKDIHPLVTYIPHPEMVFDDEDKER